MHTVDEAADWRRNSEVSRVHSNHDCLRLEPMNSTPRSVKDVTVEVNHEEGHILFYLRLSDDDVYRNYEVTPAIIADVSESGRLVGVEIVHTFPPNEKKFYKGIILVDEIKEVIEKKFGVSIEAGFEDIRLLAEAFA